MDCIKRILKILYVNDDREDLEIFRDQMAQAGFASVASFVPEANIGEIIDYLDENRASLPDAILVDARLPLIDSFEVLRAVRSNPYYKAIPVVMISGSEIYLERMRRLHPDIKADGYLSKPINLEELSEILRPFSICMKAAA